MKWLVFAVIATTVACSSGSVEASGDAAMSVHDAIYWSARNTGDPGADGSIIVLLGDQGDLCNDMENKTISGATELLAFQIFSGSSDSTPQPGDYPAQQTGKRVEVKRASSEGGCGAPIAKFSGTGGTLKLTQAPGASQDDVEGTFDGTVGSPETPLKASFSARFCDAGAEAMNGLVRNLKFKSCSN